MEFASAIHFARDFGHLLLHWAAFSSTTACPTCPGLVCPDVTCGALHCAPCVASHVVGTTPWGHFFVGFVVGVIFTAGIACCWTGQLQQAASGGAGSLKTPLSSRRPDGGPVSPSLLRG